MWTWNSLLAQFVKAGLLIAYLFIRFILPSHSDLLPTISSNRRIVDRCWIPLERFSQLPFLSNLYLYATRLVPRSFFRLLFFNLEFSVSVNFALVSNCKSSVNNLFQLPDFFPKSFFSVFLDLSLDSFKDLRRRFIFLTCYRACLCVKLSRTAGCELLTGSA